MYGLWCWKSLATDNLETSGLWCPGLWHCFSLALSIHHTGHWHFSCIGNTDLLHLHSGAYHNYLHRVLPLHYLSANRGWGLIIVIISKLELDMFVPSRGWRPGLYTRRWWVDLRCSWACNIGVYMLGVKWGSTTCGISSIIYIEGRSMGLGTMIHHIHSIGDIQTRGGRRGRRGRDMRCIDCVINRRWRVCVRSYMIIRMEHMVKKWAEHLGRPLLRLPLALTITFWIRISAIHAFS